MSMFKEVETPSNRFTVKTANNKAIFIDPPMKKINPIAIDSGIPSNNASPRVVNSSTWYLLK